jgi:hypothetical protein
MSDNTNSEFNGLYLLDNPPPNTDPTFRLTFAKKDDESLKMGAERLNDKGCHISLVKDGMIMTRKSDNKKFRVHKTDKVKWYIWLREV